MTVNHDVTGSSPVRGAKKKDRFKDGLFSIQSEGLACNRRQAYVITRSVYGITAGVFFLRIDYIPPTVDFIHHFVMIPYRLRRIPSTASP